MRYRAVMDTVVETPAYLRSAKAGGRTDVEMADAKLTISANPLAGVLIKGSGGCRKVRIAGRGKGKSGGYRVVTYYGGDRVPVFLIAVLSKGSDANFTDAQVNQLAVVAATLVP